MKKKLLALFIIVSLFRPFPVRAGSESGFGCGAGFGPIASLLCDPSSDESTAANQLNKTLSGILGFLTLIAGLWFMIQFLIAGIGWISAGGDKSKIESSRNKIIHSLIGLLIIVGAWVIIGVIGKIAGLDILNPGEIILNLKI